MTCQERQDVLGGRRRRRLLYLKLVAQCLSRKHCLLLSERSAYSAARRAQLLQERGTLSDDVHMSTCIDDVSGTRQFIASTYPVLKQHNPDLHIMIREAKGTPARVFARFGASNSLHPHSMILTGCGGLSERGVERHVEVDNLPEKDVASRVAQLLNLS